MTPQSFLLASAQIGDSNTSLSAEDGRRILDGVCELLPALRNAPVLTQWAGLRPGRTQLRLEAEAFGSPGDVNVTGEASMHVIHNYGHGGGGMSLAWGCAGDVVRLLHDVL